MIENEQMLLGVCGQGKIRLNSKAPEAQRSVINTHPKVERSLRAGIH